MSVWSRFDPVSGSYEYFEAPGALAAINDDLPLPRLPSATTFGVPSVECGRHAPDSAERIGTGELARGHVASPLEVKLSGVDGDADGSIHWPSVLMGAAAVAGIWVAYQFVRK